MNTKKILKGSLSLGFVMLIALFLSACGSSNSSTDDSEITYNGITNPAAITKENAAEFSTKALALGFATDIEDAYSSAVMKAVEPLSASSSKSIAKLVNNDVVRNSFDFFLKDIIDHPDKPLGCIGLKPLNIIIKAIEDENPDWRLYSGEITKDITFDDATDTFTIVYTFTDSKICNGPANQDDRLLVDIDGSRTDTITFDYSDYVEPATKASPVAEWENMTDAEKYDWAIEHMDDYSYNSKTTACNNLSVTYTNKSDPSDNAVLDADMFGEGYGGYDSYNRIESDSYQLDGDFDYTIVFDEDHPAEGVTNASATIDSTFNGFLKLVSGITDLENNYKSDFELIANGESQFATVLDYTYTQTPEAPPLAKGTYANISFNTNNDRTARIHGNIDFRVKTTDAVTSESLVIQIRDGLFEDSDSYYSTDTASGDTAKLEDGEKYIYRSSDLARNETKRISGNATAKLDIKVHALDNAAQSVDFKLDSGSITFSGAIDQKTIIVKKFNADGDDTFVVEDSSMDISTKTETSYSGSASITHKEMLAELSGEYSVENYLTLHDDNPDDFTPDTERVGDHVDDIWTKSSKTSFNNMKFRTDFCDIGLQGSISEERDLTADYYDGTRSTYNLDMIINDNINAEDYWFDNYVIGISREETAKAVNNTSVINASLSGRFHHSAYGYVDVSTMTGFSMAMNPNLNIPANEDDINSSFPTTGKLLLKGSDNSSATFSVFTEDNKPAGYTIKADTDGNGEIDFMSSAKWPDIDDFLNNYWLSAIANNLYDDYDYLILEIEDEL